MMTGAVLTTRREVHAAALLCLLTAGCGTAAVMTAPTTPAADDCALAASDPLPLVRTVVHGPIAAAHAPVPRGDAERLVFRQLYETLITIGCDGSVRSGLAARWSIEDDGRTFRFRLRDDAVFADGSRLTVHDVLESWTANRAAAPSAARLLVRADGVGERELRVELATPADASFFAAPVFAVARRETANVWPAGSTPYRVAEAGDGIIRLVRADAGPELVVRSVAGGDGRRALDTGADALLTTDPAVLAYARALPSFEVTPLGWSHSMLLATRAIGPPAAPPADVLQSLARDVVRGDARAPGPDLACTTSGAAMTAAAASRLSRSVLYDEADPASRALAERVVALAWPAEQAPAWLRALLPAGYASAGAPVATAVQSAALADAIRQGAGLAWVVAVPRVTGQPCVDVAVDAAPAAVALAARSLTLTALVETRTHAVLRAGAVVGVVRGDGVIRFGRQP
jgi:hypothetical protein